MFFFTQFDHKVDLLFKEVDVTCSVGQQFLKDVLLDNVAYRLIVLSGFCVKSLSHHVLRPNLAAAISFGVVTIRHRAQYALESVSYTHLTLPTIYPV